MRITIIHSPSAGYEQLSRDSLLAMTREAGYHPDYYSTHDKDYERCLIDPGKFVVVAGGDGTVARIAKKLAGRDIPIAILPAGTANNIAVSLGVCVGKFDEQVRQWTAFRTIPMDLGEAVSEHGKERFVESVGMGLFSQTILNLAPLEQRKQTPFSTRHEDMLHAQTELRRVLHDTKALECTLSVDGVDHSGRYLLVEIMNIPRVGPNLHLAKEADASDGLLDVVLLKEDDRETLDRHLSHCIEGRSEHAPAFMTFRGRTITIDALGSPVHVDDDVDGAKSIDHKRRHRMELSVKPRQLTFLAP